MEEKQTTLISNFGKLEANVGTQLESIDKKTEDTQNNLKELQQVIHNTLKEFHQVLFSHPFLHSLPSSAIIGLTNRPQVIFYMGFVRTLLLYVVWNS